MLNLTAYRDAESTAIAMLLISLLITTHVHAMTQDLPTYDRMLHAATRHQQIFV